MLNPDLCLMVQDEKEVEVVMVLVLSEAAAIDSGLDLEMGLTSLLCDHKI
ncbi:hypothetical protein T12_4238 [Trichinella patagoniensis]|uniref:Uncharacterized protein n=1 Tax=Trichinella patagoniensis TaxID=990121 RepID=A0A0V0XE69_9BILA|nr:hypothetical protein T12_4238 [Trichinella patagoniensis]